MQIRPPQILLDFAKSQWKQITVFLKQYIPIWQTEVLYAYPQFEQLFPEGWIDELAQKSLTEVSPTMLKHNIKLTACSLPD